MVGWNYLVSILQLMCIKAHSCTKSDNIITLIVHFLHLKSIKKNLSLKQCDLFSISFDNIRS